MGSGRLPWRPTGGRLKVSPPRGAQQMEAQSRSGLRQKGRVTVNAAADAWGAGRVCGGNPISSYWVPIAPREKARNKRPSCP
ncbi:hypothetical protein KUCAC02_014487 [Chaenocephalus aceratus]|uniref:Uncharacterized protein n=1 Tax=Chaenocephalus aceratus TaxID=36190 RepID=A0ACB9WEQ5_CHAAC|nr:hypothetical protein KUCAC02_014487 [Chaenocephalus aceratus]